MTIAAVALAVFATFYVTRLVMQPIGGEPRQIERIVSKVATGDFSVAFDPRETLTGIYASTKQMVQQLSMLIRQINSSSDELGQAAIGLSSVSKQTAANCDHQMNMLTQAATAMEQMTCTVHDINRSAQQAADAAREADLQAIAGKTVVEETVNNIQRLADNVEEVSVIINNLEQEADNVSSILSVIRSIAEQTNLLALNAAIEAARAGEHGRGFAVVADEVRTLASRTQSSTAEIQQLLSRFQLETKKSVQSMAAVKQDAHDTAGNAQKTSQVLDDIMRAVSLINDMNHQIAAASEQQNVVAEQINQSVNEINTLAKSTSNGASDTVRSSDSMHQLAESLRQSCQRFKVS